MLIADQWEGLAHIDPRARMYLQDLGLFRDIAAEARSWFQPSVTALDVMRDGHEAEWIMEAHPIALHVRRGDTVTQPAGYQPLATLDYYRHALGMFPDYYPVVVFSDDPSWCVGHLAEILGGRKRMFVDHGAGRSHKPNIYRRQPAMDWLDMQLMALCGRHVISNSTYAWWGAWLSGNRNVMYPSTWWGHKLDYIDSDLMIPEGWVKIPC